MEEQRARWAGELTLIDVADAFPHLPVHEKELEHTLTPDIEGDRFLLFRALLFGFRTAPLLWSRVVAWTSRLLQSCLPAEEAKHQTYLDDSLWALQGTLARRNLVLGFILHTMAALGFKLSVTKGERGASVTWAPGGPEDSDGQAVLAFRGSTQNQVDPEGLLCRHGGQGRRDPLREGARLALLQYLNVTKDRPSRKVSLTGRSMARVSIITDASRDWARYW